MSVELFLKDIFLKNDLFLNSGPALLMKEAKKMENEKWVSREPARTAMSERTGLPTGGWPQMQDGSCWSDTDQSEAR